MTWQAKHSTALIREYYRRVDQGDLGMLELFHPEVRYKRPGYPLLQGIAELREFYASTRVIASGRHRVDAILQRHGRVAVEGRFAGSLQDGTQVDLPFSDFFDLVQVGAVMRIHSRRTYFDDVHV